jgi:hypothetical protein
MRLALAVPVRLELPMPERLAMGVPVKLAELEGLTLAVGVRDGDEVPVGVMLRLVYSDGRGDATTHVHIPAGPTSAQL